MGCNIKEAAKTFNVEYATREEEYREGDDMLYMVSLTGLQKQFVIERLYFRPINFPLLNENISSLCMKVLHNQIRRQYCESIHIL